MIVKEGFPFIFISFIAGAVLIALSRVFGAAQGVSCVCAALGAVFIIFAVFCAFFFRDPKIALTQGEHNILSPCNGTVMEIEETENKKIIRVFLSIFNVHLQRSPVDGVVKSVEHKDGVFLMAMNPKAHLLNEQNIITIESPSGVFTVYQIAGFLARRCVSWVKAGDVLKKGDKIGMIKFSSQVDLHLPKNCAVTVKTSDKIRAGISIIGNINK
jgi:phosphatidylserine decarboxylase